MILAASGQEEFPWMTKGMRVYLPRHAKLFDFTPMKFLRTQSVGGIVRIR